MAKSATFISPFSMRVAVTVMQITIRRLKAITVPVMIRVMSVMCNVTGFSRGRVMSVINVYSVYLFIPGIHARSCHRGKLICLAVKLLLFCYIVKNAEAKSPFTYVKMSSCLFKSQGGQGCLKLILSRLECNQMKVLWCLTHNLIQQVFFKINNHSVYNCSC